MTPQPVNKQNGKIKKKILDEFMFFHSFIKFIKIQGFPPFFPPFLIKKTSFPPEKMLFGWGKREETNIYLSCDRVGIFLKSHNQNSSIINYLFDKVKLPTENYVEKSLCKNGK